MSPYEDVSYKRLTLELKPVMAQAILPSGLTHVGFDVVERTAEHLALQLRALVLTDQAGETVSDSAEFSRAMKPRWLPRFVRRRFPIETAILSVTATPLWSYPDNTLAVPDLGGAVHVLVHSRSLMGTRIAS